MLEFVSVSKWFKDGTAAINDVSFSLAKGQFCVILGPSGAGKSTLLRLVNGLAQPSSGEVIIDGQALTPKALATLRPQIGMIHQSFSLALRASVATNVISGALPVIATWRALIGFFTQAHRLRACTLIAGVGLDESHLRRRVSELSGGQQQRVGIARAFMLSPNLILADEPVASLDPKISDDIIRLIAKEAKANGSTVLCSLHQLDLARAYADRIIALKSGRVVFDGSPEALTPAILSEIYGAQFKPETAELVEEIQ